MTSEEGEEKKKKKKETNEYGLLLKRLTWFDKPKFHLSFPGEDEKTLNFVDFEISLTRFERIWKPIVSKGVVNSMLGIYVFEFDEANWRKKCVNFEMVEFVP